MIRTRSLSVVGAPGLQAPIGVFVARKHARYRRYAKGAKTLLYLTALELGVACPFWRINLLEAEVYRLPMSMQWGCQHRYTQASKVDMQGAEMEQQLCILLSVLEAGC